MSVSIDEGNALRLVAKIELPSVLQEGGNHDNYPPLKKRCLQTSIEQTGPKRAGTHCYFIDGGNSKKQLRSFCSCPRHHADCEDNDNSDLFTPPSPPPADGSASTGSPTSKYDVKFLQMEPNDSKL
ncbi:hypothetical protein Trydic_g3060 [Trypoxylus dichotomus]